MYVCTYKPYTNLLYIYIGTALLSAISHTESSVSSVCIVFGPGRIQKTHLARPKTGKLVGGQMIRKDTPPSTGAWTDKLPGNWFLPWLSLNHRPERVVGSSHCVSNSLVGSIHTPYWCHYWYPHISPDCFRIAWLNHLLVSLFDA